MSRVHSSLVVAVVTAVLASATTLFVQAQAQPIPTTRVVGYDSTGTGSVLVLYQDANGALRRCAWRIGQSVSGAADPQGCQTLPPQ